MTNTPPETARNPADPVRRWQIAVAVLGVLVLTLLVINLVLRSRVDTAGSQRTKAVDATEGLTARNAELQARNEELLTQLSTSHERMTGVAEQLGMDKELVAAADANVRRQVAAQKAAERAAQSANAAAARSRAQLAAARAQLRNAQTCSAGALKALGQIHAGPDIESGAEQAAETLESVLPACRAGLTQN